MTEQCSIEIIPYTGTAAFPNADLDWAYQVISPTGNIINGACKGSKSYAEEQAKKVAKKLKESSFTKKGIKKFDNKLDHVRSVMSNNKNICRRDIQVLCELSGKTLKKWEEAGLIEFNDRLGRTHWKRGQDAD